MLYYLSLLTHTDQLAVFRLFKYLTFRSGAAVVTALVIAFWINPMLIRWLKVRQGKGQPTIVIRFWIVAVVLALLGLATLKLR